MRALSTPYGAIPRVFKNHRTPEGHAYRIYLTDILARIGPLPLSAHPTLRAAGEAVIELGKLGLDLEAARHRKRRREANQIRRSQFALREQLTRLERRLEELSQPNGRHNIARQFAEMHRLREAAK